MISKRQAALQKNPWKEYSANMRWMKAMQEGFDKRYCSSKVKRFTSEEIAEFEKTYRKHKR